MISVKKIQIFLPYINGAMNCAKMDIFLYVMCYAKQCNFLHKSTFSIKETPYLNKNLVTNCKLYELYISEIKFDPHIIKISFLGPFSKCMKVSQRVKKMDICQKWSFFLIKNEKNPKKNYFYKICF